MNASDYGDGKKQVDNSLSAAFLQTLAHEWMHVQQSLPARAFVPEFVLDNEAEAMGEKHWQEFLNQRNRLKGRNG